VLDLFCGNQREIGARECYECATAHGELLKAHAGCSFQKNFCTYCKMHGKELEWRKKHQPGMFTTDPRKDAYGIQACDSRFQVSESAANFFQKDIPGEELNGDCYSSFSPAFAFSDCLCIS
jgi:hypothetical protein